MSIEFFVPNAKCNHIKAPDCKCVPAFSGKMGLHEDYYDWIKYIFRQWRKARTAFYEHHNIDHELMPESCPCEWCKDFHMLYLLKMHDRFLFVNCERFAEIFDKIEPYLRAHDIGFMAKMAVMTKVALKAFRASIDNRSLLIIRSDR